MGCKFDQAVFVIHATLQFYYEICIKLKRALEDSGKDWTLKVDIDENILRIAHKI